MEEDEESRSSKRTRYENENENVEEEGEGEGEEEEEEDEEEDEEAPVVNVRIQNVVATLSTNTRLDLDRIASTARNAEYNPRRSVLYLSVSIFPFLSLTFILLLCAHTNIPKICGSDNASPGAKIDCSCVF